MLELITSGVELMLVGMGIVYAFLAMLVGAINVMTAVVSRYFPEPPQPELPVANANEEAATIAAIGAAIHQYRAKHK